MRGIYAVKPRFQHALRGIEDLLVARRVHPDVVTLAALLVSAAGGLVLVLAPVLPGLLLAVPVVALVRTALNALDGLVARRLGLARPWGEALNEVCDRLADVLLLGSFLLIPGVNLLLGTAALVMVLLASYAGLLGKAVGGRRQYGGILGKADRMLLLAVAAPLALVLGIAPVFNGFLAIVLLGAVVTFAQRLRAIHAEVARHSTGEDDHTAGGSTP
jgi:CDP-diacylglycerol--glycerol-3-phosphate 3-phosphatidyltransferase